MSGLDYAADAYLSYANSVTGASDTNVGDAIMTLAAGYGQGGAPSPAVDVYFDVVEQTSSAQTITVGNPGGFQLHTAEIALCIIEYQGDWVPDSTKNAAFRTVAVQVGHTNWNYYTGVNAFGSVGVTPAGGITYQFSSGTAENIYVARYAPTSINIQIPRNTNTIIHPGRWRLRTYKIADAPTI